MRIISRGKPDRVWGKCYDGDHMGACFFPAFPRTKIIFERKKLESQVFKIKEFQRPLHNISN